MHNFDQVINNLNYRKRKMGLLSQLRALKKKQGEARILVLGLDNAGKTTILRALSQEETQSIMPTKGFNIKTLVSSCNISSLANSLSFLGIISGVQVQDGFKLNVWDIGGQREIRPYWRNYYDQTDAIVYVVDSSDEARVAEVKDNLTELMGEELLARVPLLVFANKQDLDLALGADEVSETLALENLSDRAWNIQACSALDGTGLPEGMSWLIETINAAQANTQ